MKKCCLLLTTGWMQLEREGLKLENPSTDTFQGVSSIHCRFSLCASFKDDVRFSTDQDQQAQTLL